MGEEAKIPSRKGFGIGVKTYFWDKSWESAVRLFKGRGVVAKEEVQVKG